MENNLREMRSRVSALPVLQARLEKLRTQLCEAENAVHEMKKKFEAESQDVDELLEGSLTSFFLRLIGKYEGKLTQETQEQFRAKTEYDEAEIRLDDVRAQQQELLKRISDLKTEEYAYEAALEQRKKQILSGGGDAYNRYMEIHDHMEELEKQVAETDEALRAARRVNATASSALDSLDSAHGWANYDVWLGDGIFSHAAKYEHIDQAEALMSRLDVQIRSLQDELKDVNMPRTDTNFEMVNSTTRAVDFWLDNIFTDMNVRSIISENQYRLNTLCKQVTKLLDMLQSNKNSLQSQIRTLESREEALLLEETP